MNAKTSRQNGPRGNFSQNYTLPNQHRTQGSKEVEFLNKVNIEQISKVGKVQIQKIDKIYKLFTEERLQRVLESWPFSRFFGKKIVGQANSRLVQICCKALSQGFVKRQLQLHANKMVKLEIEVRLVL